MSTCHKPGRPVRHLNAVTASSAACEVRPFEHAWAARRRRVLRRMDDAAPGGLGFGLIFVREPRGAGCVLAQRDWRPAVQSRGIGSRREGQVGRGGCEGRRVGGCGREDEGRLMGGGRGRVFGDHLLRGPRHRSEHLRAFQLHAGEEIRGAGSDEGERRHAGRMGGPLGRDGLLGDGRRFAGQLPAVLRPPRHPTPRQARRQSVVVRLLVLVVRVRLLLP